MHRLTVLLAIAAATMLCLTAGIGPASPTLAQEATPAAPGFELAPGVTAEALAFVAGQESPALYRITFAPGVTYTIMPAPELSLVHVERGALSLTLDAPVQVTRAGTDEGASEGIAAGADTTVNAGDHLVLPLMVGGEVRNEGDVAAAVLVAAIFLPEGAVPAATPGA